MDRKREQPRHQQREIDEQGHDLILAQPREIGRGKTADQPHDRGRRALPERKPKRDDRCDHEQCEGDWRADQRVKLARHIECAVKARDPRTRKRLTDAAIAADARDEAHRLARNEQRHPEERGNDHAHAGAEQPRLDRIAHEIKAREHKRDAADPDRQFAADQRLDPLGKRGGGDVRRFNRRSDRFRIWPRRRRRCWRFGVVRYDGHGFDGRAHVRDGQRRDWLGGRCGNMFSQCLCRALGLGAARLLEPIEPVKRPVKPRFEHRCAPRVADQHPGADDCEQHIQQKHESPQQ